VEIALRSQRSSGSIGPFTLDWRTTGLLLSRVSRCKKGKWISNLPHIIKYIKISYQEWLFAGGEDSGENFFVDLWDPKALKAFADPSKDTHPGAQLLRDWNKAKQKEKDKGPTPKRKRGRRNP
jgi:hypothetical protein